MGSPPHRKCIWNVTAHKGFVRGISLTSGGDGILSVGDDRCVRLWKLDYDIQKWTNPVDGKVASTMQAVSYLRSPSF